MTNLTMPCDTCHGKGEDPDFGGKCSFCGGSGRKATAVSTHPLVKNGRFVPRPRSFEEAVAHATPPRVVPGGAGNNDGPTEKQIKFLKSLCEDKGQAYVAPKTRKAASEQIDSLLKMSHKPTAPKNYTPSEAVGEGMYRTDDGQIYKVQLAVHGSGFPYAKRLVKLDEPITKRVRGKMVTITHEFEMAKGMQFKLRPEDKMTFDEAKEWGALYGACCVCGITLTDDSIGGSIENGIGPVCAGKF